MWFAALSRLARLFLLAAAVTLGGALVFGIALGADAARDAGLRVGFYFSLSDWHHPDYPPFTDADRPYRMGVAPRPTPASRQNGAAWYRRAGNACACP